MRITDMKIEGFGIWSDLDVSHLSSELTVFVGRNEAGKTTLMHFIRSVLYGLTRERRARYIPPVRGNRGGGALRLMGTHGTFHVKRDFGIEREGGGLGNLTVTRPEGTLVGSHQLGSLLSDVDESIFQNVFAFGLRDLQELGTLDDTKAADLLYKLTTGLDRVSLVDVMQTLTGTRNDVLSEEGLPGPILELCDRRDELMKDIAALTRSGRDWSKLTSDQAALDGEILSLENKVEELEKRSRVTEMALQLSKMWRDRVSTERKIKSLGEITPIPAGAIGRLDGLNKAIAERSAQADHQKQVCLGLRDEAKALPINHRLWECKCRIEALGEYLPWIDSLEGQVDRLRDEVTKTESDLESSGNQIAMPLNSMRDKLPELAQNASEILKGPARAVREANSRLEEIRAEAESTREESAELIQHMDSVLADFGHTDLSSALQQAGDRVTAFRKRIELEDRIDSLEQSAHELEREHEELLEDQLMPWPQVLMFGGFFVLGVVLFFIPWFFPSQSDMGFVLVLAGLVISGLSVVFKLMAERNLKLDLEECEQQVDQIGFETKRAREEREETEGDLPRGNGSLDARLKQAQSEAEKLEDLLPLQTECEAAAQKNEAMEHRLREAEEVALVTKKRWRQTLREAGLPENATPDNLKQIADEAGRMSETVQQIGTQQTELDSRRNELAVMVGRIEKLMRDLDIQPRSSDPRARIQQLGDVLSKQQHLVERRRDLRRQYKEALAEYRKFKRSLDKLQSSRSAMFTGAGITEEREFRQLAIKQDRYHELAGKRDELTGKILAALGKQIPEQVIAQEIDGNTDQVLQDRLNLLRRELDDAHVKQAELHQQQGELNQEIKSTADDRRLASARLELSCVERRLERLIGQWRVAASTEWVLESLCRKYEADRQPETLNAASQFLDQITEGRYTRIWTPMHDNSLRVNTPDGKSLPVEVLSRGTREAVFISLRMSLVDAYAKRGIVLPLVLDDVLVNFDYSRARSAATVLIDFARAGHQLLFFTCHDHMMRIFQDLGADVRALPNRFGQIDLDTLTHSPPVEQEVVEPELPPDPLPEPQLVTEPVAVAEPDVDEPAEAIEHQPVQQEQEPQPDPEPEQDPDPVPLAFEPADPEPEVVLQQDVVEQERDIEEVEAEQSGDYWDLYPRWWDEPYHRQRSKTDLSPEEPATIAPFWD